MTQTDMNEALFREFRHSNLTAVDFMNTVTGVHGSEGCDDALCYIEAILKESRMNAFCRKM